MAEADNSEAVRALQAAFLDTNLVGEDPGMSRVAETLGRIAHDDLKSAMLSGPTGLRTEFDGIDGLLEAWAEWLEPFESFLVLPVGEVMGNGDVVVSFVEQVGTMPGGAELRADAAVVSFFRDGLLERIEFHLDRDEALRVAGLAAPTSDNQ